jgi:hypothetical protein
MLPPNQGTNPRNVSQTWKLTGMEITPSANKTCGVDGLSSVSVPLLLVTLSPWAQGTLWREPLCYSH